MNSKRLTVRSAAVAVVCAAVMTAGAASTYLKTVTCTMTGTPHAVTGTLASVRGYVETMGVDITAGETATVSVITSEGLQILSRTVTARAQWPVRIPAAMVTGATLEQSNQWVYAPSYGNCTALWSAVSTGASVGTVRMIYSR